jgi:sorting nexin-29
MEDLNIPPKKLIALVKTTMKNTESEPTNVKNGVRQGDALACLLFIIALEKVIRDAAVNTRGTVFYKSVQILAYADDIDITGRTQAVMIEAFTSLEN